MEPFCPPAFPPRRLNKKAYAALLKTAHRELSLYNEALLKLPQELHSILLFTEAIASLNSQKLDDELSCQVFQYVDTLEWASKKMKYEPLSKKLVCTLHRKIKQGLTPLKDLGVYRNRQNWIGPAGRKEEAYFYPPKASEVHAWMENLFHYSEKQSSEPLVQIAMIFAQMLIIHPFMDGNGRVARILIPLLLYRKHVVPYPVFFLSAYFQQHRLRYFQTLFQTTEEAQWEKWITFFLKGVIVESKKYRRLFKALSPKESFP